jgi:hypothetical protein
VLETCILPSRLKAGRKLSMLSMIKDPGSLFNFAIVAGQLIHWPMEVFKLGHHLLLAFGDKIIILPINLTLSLRLLPSKKFTSSKKSLKRVLNLF